MEVEMAMVITSQLPTIRCGSFRWVGCRGFLNTLKSMPSFAVPQKKMSSISCSGATLPNSPQLATTKTNTTMDDLTPTKLDYFTDMWKLQSKSTLLSYFQGEDDRRALILDSTIFHPQGGGQPADTGLITISGESDFKFVVQDVRSKDGIVFHYGLIENVGEELESKLKRGIEVLLQVDESRRKLNARLHSAGHLLDACMKSVGLGHLEPTKGHHFPDGPFVEYKGTVPQDEAQSKQKELESEANKLISRGGTVTASILPYEEASELCGGLPDYIPKGSTPRILKLADTPGCPCGGTHVSDISEISSIKVSQIRSKKGKTKVSYTVGS